MPITDVYMYANLKNTLRHFVVGRPARWCSASSRSATPSSTPTRSRDAAARWPGSARRLLADAYAAHADDPLALSRRRWTRRSREEIVPWYENMRDQDRGARDALEMQREGTDPCAFERADGSTAATLRGSEAAQLLSERARAVRPDFQITDENALPVAEICRRLDGIPLAIELAASRLRLFSPGQIASRLNDRFRLLTGGSRTAVPRQQTLQALIDWSYELLSEEEKKLFRRLSVFVGGWTFEAAEAIGQGLDVLELLDQLVNKSLVGSEQEGQGFRFSYLETIRQYACERLYAAGSFIYRPSGYQ